MKRDKRRRVWVKGPTIGELPNARKDWGVPVRDRGDPSNIIASDLIDPYDHLCAILPRSLHRGAAVDRMLRPPDDCLDRPADRPRRGEVGDLDYEGK